MLFSVFTPCYNSSKTLEACFECLKWQTYKNFEWILVDDCSPDGGKTRELIKKISREAPFTVKYYFFEENHFGARSMHKACEIAAGEYLFLLDHDDIFTGNALERVAWYIANYCNGEVVAVRPRCVSEKGLLLGPSYRKKIFISTEGEMRYNEGMMAELMTAGRTEVMKEAAAHMQPGYTYAFLMAKISEKYKMVYPDEALRIYDMSVPTSFSNNRSVNTRFPQAKVDQYFYLWQSYSAYVHKNLLQTLREMMHTHSLIHRYKLKPSGYKLKAPLLKILFYLTAPAGIIKSLVFKMTGKKI
ncbi:MAG: glycosyltransferase family 2 protein [Ferruginibacter sp.]